VSTVFASRPVRATIALGLLAYLLWLSNPSEVGRALAGARLWPVALAVGLTLFDRALMAYRWLALLGPLPADTRPPFRAVMRIFFVSTFVGTFLPASVGGDAVRAYALSGQRVPLSLSVASVIMDRALGTAAILLLGLGAMLVAPSLGIPGLVPVFVTGAAVSLALAALVFSTRAADLLTRAAGRLPFPRMTGIVGRLLGAVGEYRYHHQALVTVLGASLGVQVLRVLQAYCLGIALGITAPLWSYFVAIPLVLLVMLLPVTINGLGTSQAAFLWCFGALGVGRAEAFALSVLFVALGVVGNLPGGLLYATGGLPRHAS
jgi:uncharacterized protein (TIRG00374 family)